MIRAFVIGLLLALGAVALAQDAPTGTIGFAVNLRSGPNNHYDWVGVAQPGTVVHLVERNRAGTWLRFQVRQADGSVAQDAWVLSGYVITPPAFDYGTLPVSARADGDPARTADPLIARLYATPVTPPVDPAMDAVLARGRELGRQANTVSKVGDSIIANPAYLEPMATPGVDLGPYRFLGTALRFFGPQMGASQAARLGLGSALVWDPFWSSPASCLPNEGPLDCEYRVRNPAVALVSFSMNDIKLLSVDDYRAAMTRIVEATLEQGVIPVLTTFASHPESPTYRQSLAYNAALIELAETYRVPIINLWLASQALPDYGLEVDMAHMKNSGLGVLTFNQGTETYSGVVLQNLLALAMLDALRESLQMDAPIPETTAEAG
jgi:hypothetical protein